VDIDGDGQRDILSGSYSRMDKDMAGLFQVLYGKKDGTFRNAEVLKGTNGEPLIIPTQDEKQLTEKICTRPFAVDWERKGNLDLIVGNFAGTFYRFKGQGKGKFAPMPEILTVAGKPLKLPGAHSMPGAHSDPFVIDWDGDGALDLLSGSMDGGVYWAKNAAGKGKVPELTPFQPLIKARPPVADGQIVREEELTGPSLASRIWVDDINGDGKLDILVGDTVRLVSPAKGIAEADFKKKQADWQKELQAAEKDLNAVVDPKARAKAAEEFHKLHNRRSEFMREEMTGFVWAYLQK
jgi:hypothetical protein